MLFDINHVIPSGFRPDHATFYNPAIPSGLNCITLVDFLQKSFLPQRAQKKRNLIYKFMAKA